MTRLYYYSFHMLYGVVAHAPLFDTSKGGQVMQENTRQDKVQILFSYAQSDERVYAELLTHLIPFISEQPVQFINTDYTRFSNQRLTQDAYIRKAHMIILLVSTAYLSDEYCTQQMNSVLDRWMREPGTVNVLLVQMNPCGWQQTRLHVLQQTLPKNSVPLTQWQDVNRGLLQVSRELAGEIRKTINKIYSGQNGSESSTIDPSIQIHSPYVGLRPFGLRDASYFFGRDEFIQSMLHKLLTAIEGEAPGHDNRLMVVIGASGSGKTSVVNAGLLPRLKQARNL